MYTSDDIKKRRGGGYSIRLAEGVTHSNKVDIAIAIIAIAPVRTSFTF